MEEAENKLQGRFQVLFGNASQLSQTQSDNTILIVPDENKWNDFGRLRPSITCKIRVAGNDSEFMINGFIGFLDGAPSKQNTLHEIVQDSGNLVFPATTEKYRFFTMIPDMEGYRKIVREFSAKVAEEALIAMNDLVALEEFKPSVNWIELAITTDVFTTSFVRDSEAYFTYKNAGPLLRGLEFEQLGKLSSTLQLSFKLPGVMNAHNLKFSFDQNGILPKRISVLIGKNGVGKSQTLGRIARSVIEGGLELTDGSENKNNRPIISRLLAFAPTNEAESVFPVDRRKKTRIWYRRYSMNRSRRSKRNEYLPDLIVQLVRSNQRIKNRSRWNIFLSSLQAFSSPKQISLSTNNIETPFLAIYDLSNANEQQQLVRFASIDLTKEPQRVIDGIGYPLSSGEISFIKFAAQVSLHIENGSLLLLDEPETHLHPNFISRFVSLLDGLLEQTGSAAIIATHSVYFVREVFRDQVTILRVSEDGYVHAEIPRLRTFGGDVGAISFFVFGEDHPSLLVNNVKDRLLKANKSWDQLYEGFKDELSVEMLTLLRHEIESK